MTGELRNLVGEPGAVRMTRYHGRDHLVIPVVALMDGVIHAVNAPSAERVTTETLTRAAKSWEGKLICYGHPVRDGRQISADEDGVADAYGFGTIRNSRMLGSKLLMDAYVDPVRAEKLGGAEFLRRLQTGIPPCSVSVGAFVSVDHTPGTFNGKPYKAVWSETVGNHLAFLPKSRGACSIEDGCQTHRAAESAHELQDAEFNPSQERDKDGKWTGGGGSGGGSETYSKKETVRALDAYGDVEDGRAINDILRHGSSDNPDAEDIAAEVVPVMDRAMTVGTDKQTVYRAMVDPGGKASFSKLKPGDTFTDKGFISTTKSQEDAAFMFGAGGSFAEGESGTTIFASIEVPPSSLRIDSDTIKGIKGLAPNELILQRGTKFEVASVRRFKAHPDNEGDPEELSKGGTPGTFLYQLNHPDAKPPRGGQNYVVLKLRAKRG